MFNDYKILCNSVFSYGRTTCIASNMLKDMMMWCNDIVMISYEVLWIYDTLWYVQWYNAIGDAMRTWHASVMLNNMISYVKWYDNMVMLWRYAMTI